MPRLRALRVPVRAAGGHPCVIRGSESCNTWVQGGGSVRVGHLRPAEVEGEAGMRRKKEESGRNLLSPDPGGTELSGNRAINGNP